MGDGPNRTEVLLLGPIRVRVRGRAVRLRGHKQEIALVRLALGDGRPVPIDSLVDDLWDGEPPKDPVHALQAHISRLRSLTELDIELVNGGYRLADASVDVDVTHFTALFERGRARLDSGHHEEAAEDLDAAIAVWRGPALGDLGDQHGLRPFVLQLNELRRNAEAARAEAHLRCGRGESLVAELRESLSADPLREATWHQLMRALWQTGREAEALAAYGQAREAFIEHLGVEPGSRLSELHGTILTGTAPPATPKLTPRAPTLSAPPVPDAAPELIGRRFEMSTLQGLWRRRLHGIADQPRPELQVVTLSGEPGIGKTRLLDEFSRAVHRDGATVLRGWCNRSGSTPYEPFAQMLQACLDGPRDADVDAELRKRRADLANVLPTIVDRIGGPAPDVPPSDLTTDPRRVMDAIAAWLSTLSRHQPLLLTIDDVQWADEQTLLLLQHLVATPRRIDALIAVGVRDRQVATTDGSPISNLLRQSASVTHLPLGTFSDEESTALIAAEAEWSSGHGSLPSWADEFVRSASGGNPLFVVELTRQLLMTDHDRVPVPPAAVTRVVENRVAHLPPEAQTLLHVASVLGTTFGLHRLAEIWERPSTELDPALAAAVRSRLIEPTAESQRGYVFSHDIVRMVLYDLLAPSERSRLHTRVARAIEASEDPRGAGVHQSLAHHYRNSDLPDAAVLAATHLHHAGRDALARGAPADAASLLSDGLELLSHDGHDQLRGRLLLALGTAQIQLALPESRSTLLEASRIASRIDDADLLTASVLANNRGWWSSAVELDHERVAMIETALSRIGDDDASRAQLLMAWALENVRHPASRATVLEASDQALSLVEHRDDTTALASVLAGRYTVMFALFEDPLECVQINERLLSLARRHGDQQMRLSAAIGLTQSTMRLGEFSIADRYLSEAEQLADTLDDPPRLWLVRGWQAMRAATRGDYVTAEDLATAAFELGDRTEQADAVTWFAGQLFTIRLMQRRLPEIVDAVHEQVETAAAGIPAWQGAMAVALAQSGRLDAAERIVGEFAIDGFDRLPRDMLWLNGMHYFAMACERLERDDIAAEMYRLLLPYSGMFATTATIGAGPVDLQLGVLARLCGQRDVADQHLRAAASLCRRIDAPVWADEATRRLQTNRSSAFAGSGRAQDSAGITMTDTITSSPSPRMFMTTE